MFAGPSPLSIRAQDKLSAKEFQKLVQSNGPLEVDGERVYRGKEVTQRAVLDFKPEPMFTDRARKKKTEGLVEFYAVLLPSGEVKVVNVTKRLPNGLTEEAQKAAVRIRFKPALLEGKAVSQIIILQYSFNR